MKRIHTVRTFWLSLVCLIVCLWLPATGARHCMAQTKTQASQPSWADLKADLTFFMANDMGRNGYYEQKPIARLMGEMAAQLKPKCVLAVGDVHHFNGVASVNDPLWMTNYELIYSHPELMIDWFPVLGNHEYRGNTQAVIDYAQVSRRWMMPSRYYTKVFSKNGVSVRVVWIDTTPLIQRYRTSDTYPDARKQDADAQLRWLDATLRQAHEDWVVVVGHHPIYAYTEKNEVERHDMQQQVLPVLHRYHNVDVYACGHIHNFQHLRMPADSIDYVVNSAAALAREPKAILGTVFCSGAEGFSVLSASKRQLRLSMVDKEGHVIHTVTRSK